MLSKPFSEIISIRVKLWPSSFFFVFFGGFDTGLVKRAAVKIFQHISFPFIRHHRQQKSKVQELLLRQLLNNYNKRCVKAPDISLWRPVRC